MSYKKTGSIHFVKLGRFGFSFWLKKSREQRTMSEIRSLNIANGIISVLAIVLAFHVTGVF